MKAQTYKLLLATLLAGSWIAGTASGATLSYVLSGSLTGTLAGSPLGGNTFQMTITANTGSGLPAFATSTAITISGAGTGTFTNQMAFTFSGSGGTFQQQGTSSSTVVSFTSVVLTGWDGLSPIGPVSAAQGDPGTWTTTPTSLGDLQVTGMTNVTFAAMNAPASSFTITTSPTLPAGSVTTLYSQTLMASGGTMPYTWSLLSGALPSGLSLSSSGVITGTPTAIGTLSFTVKVTDAASLSATQTFSLTIGAYSAFTSALRVPQIVDGGGWKTRFAIINTDQVPVTFTFQFWGDDGTSLLFPILNGTAGVLTGTLAPGTSFFAQSPGTAATLQQGWAEVASSGKIGLTAIFQYSVGGPRDSVGTEIATLSGSNIVMPFDNTQGDVTAIAIANTNPMQPLTVSMLFQTDGGSQSNTTIILPPHAHQAFVLPTMNPAVAGVRGSVQFVAGSADIAVIGLEFTPAGQFTSLGTFQ